MLLMEEKGRDKNEFKFPAFLEITPLIKSVNTIGRSGLKRKER